MAWDLGGRVVEIESASAEQLRAWLRSGHDPAASDPEWQLTTSDDESPAELGWVAGEWETDWVQRTGRVSTLSPLTGDGADLDAPAGRYAVWVRWTDGTATPVKWVGELIVR